MQVALGQQGPHNPQREISGTAIGQDVLQPDGAKADGDCRRLHVWKGLVVGGTEVLAPVDEDVTGRVTYAFEMKGVCGDNVGAGGIW